ncbi:MAG: hydrogenase maturation protease [Candidatus Brocadiia bacterium]
METIPEYYKKEILVLGCGNILYKDDGFGPAVADYLNCNYRIPDNAAALNLGLSTRGFIFDMLLSEEKPRRLVIVDAMTVPGRKPGEVFELPLDGLIKEKIDDFSLHQGPTSNLLKELRDICGLEVVIIACQPQNIPGEMQSGLSEPVRQAVVKASQIIFERYLNAI